MILGSPGHIEDTGVGLTYIQARYYDPFAFSLEPVAIVGKHGRFLSNDAVNLAESLGATLRSSAKGRDCGPDKVRAIAGMSEANGREIKNMAGRAG